MPTDLLANNQELIKYLRATYDDCDQHNDVATASLIENWIDETETESVPLEQFDPDFLCHSPFTQTKDEQRVAAYLNRPAAIIRIHA
jgi:hypothetical protein